MENSDVIETKPRFYIEILHKSVAERLHINGYNKVIIPFNKDYYFVILLPNSTKHCVVPLFIEEVIKAFPVDIIIVDLNSKVISTNIFEKKLLNKLEPEIKRLIKKNLHRLYLFDNVQEEFKDNEDLYFISISPIIKGQENPGYIFTIKRQSYSSTSENLKIIELANKILLSKTIKELYKSVETLKKVLKIETLDFFMFENNKFVKIFPETKTNINAITLSPCLIEELSKNHFLKIHKQFLKIIPLEKQIKDYVFLNAPDGFDESNFLVIGSSKTKIDEGIVKSKWLFYLLFTTFTKLKGKNKTANIFDYYQMPAILVSKQTMKIIYSNKSFKTYFGKNVLFFNQIFPFESNIKLLKKLDKKIEPFSEYVEVITADNFKSISKITVVPEIISNNKNLFAVIFKTQKHEIEIKKEFKESKKQPILDSDMFSMLIERYTSSILKSTNIEKTINYILENITTYLNTSVIFTCRAQKEGNKFTLLHSYLTKESLNLETICNSIFDTQGLLHNRDENFFEFEDINGVKKLLLVRLYTNYEDIYLLGIGFDKQFKISLIDRTTLSTFGNIIAIAYRKREENKIKAKFERKIKNLQKINEDILSTISHEIKTPLTSIMGLCEVISSKLQKNDKNLILSVKNNATRLSELLETILEVNRLKEKNQDIIKKIEINTNEFLDSIKSFVMGINKNPNVRFRLKKDNAKPFFKHDPNILYRIIINLLDNAFRHTKRGLVTLTVSFKENNLILEIKDTGEGIEEENLKNIFTPFFQENSAKTGKGKNVGLGLFIVKQLCNIIGADIHLISKKNIGTYFRITVPLEEENEQSSNN